MWKPIAYPTFSPGIVYSRILIIYSPFVSEGYSRDKTRFHVLKTPRVRHQFILPN